MFKISWETRLLQSTSNNTAKILLQTKQKQINITLELTFPNSRTKKYKEGFRFASCPI